MKIPLRTHLRRALHGHTTVEQKINQFGAVPFLVKHGLHTTDVQVRVWDITISPTGQKYLKAWHHHTLIKRHDQPVSLNAVAVLVIYPDGTARAGHYLVRVTG